MTCEHENHGDAREDWPDHCDACGAETHFFLEGSGLCGDCEREAEEEAGRQWGDE